MAEFEDDVMAFESDALANSHDLYGKDHKVMGKFPEHCYGSHVLVFLEDGKLLLWASKSQG